MANIAPYQAPQYEKIRADDLKKHKRFLKLLEKQAKEVEKAKKKAIEVLSWHIENKKYLPF